MGIFPGEPMSKYLNSYAVHIPDIGKTICAAVEYNSEDSARQAVKHINGRYTTMRSAVLGNKVKRILYNPKTIADDYRIFVGDKPGFSICCQDSLHQAPKEQQKLEKSTESVSSEDDASSGCGSSVLTSRLQSNDSHFFKFEKNLIKKKHMTITGVEKKQVGDRVQQRCAIQLM